jgi:hypothetical protein
MRLLLKGVLDSPDHFFRQALAANFAINLKTSSASGRRGHVPWSFRWTEGNNIPFSASSPWE